jgi:3-deoxy-manno-octulosonate cytidylyltransferase (CMP-KDO synthetase)
MTAVIIIPSRYASSRFPGKPLAPISGRSLIERVWRIADAVFPKVTVFVATDDDRIENHAKTFGAKVIRTGAECRNGSERVHEAVLKCGLNPDIIVNFQGDTPLTPPWVLAALIEEMRARTEIQLATPVVRLSAADHENAISKIGKNVGGTYAVGALDGRALYFSRFPLPFVRHDVKGKVEGQLPFFKHLGIYAYRPEVLARYITLEPTPLEQLEQLEQLRALENGIPIHLVEVELRGRALASVDTPEDALEVEELLRTQGDVV